ncbi:MAG: LytTR family DNA-binding domain-containing protein [Bacillota bacterium]|nr:LytTR family DNA-binding domain-containing protein [Bacillota bacterium]
MVLKALIVDDEYPARAELRYLLQSFRDRVEVVGEAAHAAEALALLQAVDYQILFLDIDMPGLSGLDLAQQVQGMSRPPAVIFVTAYDNYALQAFNVNAVDYLLKPFDEKRLHQAMNKVFRALAASDGAAPRPSPGVEQTAPRVPRLDRILAERGGKTVLVDEKEIYFAFAKDDVVYLQLQQERLLTRYTLKDLAARLRQPPFFQCHRSYLVNLRRVKEIVPYCNGTYVLLLDDPRRSEVPVSRAQGRRLKSLLGM